MELLPDSGLQPYTHGSAGPSGLNALGLRRLCTAFQNKSADLCNSLAQVAKKLCTSYVDPQALAPLMASRLIAVDKCPGVRPIGVGKLLDESIGKAIMTVLKEDILEAAGTSQLCAGHESGCEAAVDAMHQIFGDAEAALLVDAFNNLNRNAALHNIHVHTLCPPLATILTNTYRNSSHLFIDRETLLSQEGTTQGDPLAMAMYAIGILPLMDHVQNDGLKQVWFADDAAAGGKLHGAHSWWTELWPKNYSRVQVLISPQKANDISELLLARRPLFQPM